MIGDAVGLGWRGKVVDGSPKDNNLLHHISTITSLSLSVPLRHLTSPPKIDLQNENANIILTT